MEIFILKVAQITDNVVLMVMDNPSVVVMMVGMVMIALCHWRSIAMMARIMIKVMEDF